MGASLGARSAFMVARFAPYSAVRRTIRHLHGHFQFTCCSQSFGFQIFGPFSFDLDFDLFKKIEPQNNAANPARAPTASPILGPKRSAI